MTINNLVSFFLSFLYNISEGGNEPLSLPPSLSEIHDRRAKDSYVPRVFVQILRGMRERSEEVPANNAVNQWPTVYGHRSRVIGIEEYRAGSTEPIISRGRNPHSAESPARSSNGHNISR